MVGVDLDVAECEPFDAAVVGNYRVALVVGKNSGSAISRADLADFMVDQVVEETYLGRMPVVSYQVGGTMKAIVVGEPGSPEVLQF